MTRRFFCAAMLAVGLIGAGPLSAHDDYRIIGTITKVTASALDVRQKKDGKVIEMFMRAKFPITRDKKKVDKTALKVGLSVVVDARGDSLDDLEVVEVKIVPPAVKK
jgi:hypothetical protein